jgi:acyl dehydratase
MAISEAHVGRSYPPTAPYEVTAVKIAEFAAAIGDPNSAYAGEVPLAPPTFVAVIAANAWEAMFADPELDLALRRIVHGDQGYRYRRQLRAGDTVTGTLRIDKVRIRGESEIISATLDVHDADAELVCTAVTTFVHSREQG